MVPINAEDFVSVPRDAIVSPLGLDLAHFSRFGPLARPEANILDLTPFLTSIRTENVALNLLTFVRKLSKVFHKVENSGLRPLFQILLRIEVQIRHQGDP